MVDFTTRLIVFFRAVVTTLLYRALPLKLLLSAHFTLKVNNMRSQSENEIPTVYIFAASSHEGKSDARAGFGIDWSCIESGHKGGSAAGDKTKLRAELTAVLNILERAIEKKIPVIRVQHQSDELEKELKSWNSPNNDLLIPIRNLAVKMTIRLEKKRFISSFDFQRIIIIAKRVAGIHSTAAVPVNDELYCFGVRIIDIYVANNNCKLNPKAGYAVFWGYGDERNRSGLIPGEQKTHTAYFTALYHVFDTAIASNLDEIAIRTRSKAIATFITSKHVSGLMPGFLKTLRSMMARFELVQYIFEEDNSNVQSQRIAREMAFLAILQKSQLCIAGMESSAEEVARFGIYWGNDNRRNESGCIMGKHERLCAEITALGKAVEMALKENLFHLIVYTNSDDLKTFLNDWRKQWKYLGWKTPNDKSVVCIEKAKSLDKVLESMIVEVKEAPEELLREAHLLAQSAELCVAVRTFGVLIIGNNEPTARYGIIWKKNDEKNETGFIHGERNASRAKLIAIKRALQIALNNKIYSLIVKTDLKNGDEIDEILMSDVADVKKQLDYVKFEATDAAEFNHRLKEI